MLHHLRQLHLHIHQRVVIAYQLGTGEGIPLRVGRLQTEHEIKQTYYGLDDRQSLLPYLAGLGSLALHV
jgi:hypothetical protein